MTTSVDTTTQGAVAAMGTRYANAIAYTHSAILNGQSVALASAAAAGLTLAAMVRPLPGQGDAIKFDAARNLIGYGLKASKNANDDFIERTLTAGRGLANWLFSPKGRDLYVKVFSCFDLNDADGHADAVQHVCNVLADDYGIRDRKALSTLWAKATAAKPAVDGVAKAVKAIAADEMPDTAGRLAKAIVSSFSPELVAAFATAFAAENGAMLKLRADAGSAAALQGADTGALAAA